MNPTRKKNSESNSKGQALLTNRQSGQALLTNLQGGQALLIVLLAMAVILTVVLSVSSRSVVDITTSTYEEDALRAFSAAEAGVEQALLKQIPVSGTLDPNANVGFDAQLSNPLPGNTYVYPESIPSGEEATFWFVSHDNTTNALTCTAGVCARASQLQVCWATSASETPAVEISVFYDPTQQAFANPNNFTGIKVGRATRDPSATRRVNNNFSAASTGCPFPGGYRFQSNSINLLSLVNGACAVNSNNCLVMARVRMLYNATPQPIAIRIIGGGANLPAQGFQVDSVGTAGESVRSLNVVRTYPEYLSMFDNAVFSRNGLTKP